MVFDTSNPIIHRTGPSSVIYDLSQPGQTTIALPTKSTWSSGLHWHETHDEFLRVIQGSISVRLGTEIIALNAGEEAKVPKFVRHDWRRTSPDGEDVVVVESTDPKDAEKHLFFWNLNGVILSLTGEGGPAMRRPWLGEVVITMRLFLIFAELDNWPVFVDLSGYSSWIPATVMEAIVTHLIISGVALLARAIGFKAVDPAFTPSTLLSEWQSSRRTSKKSM